MLYQLLTETSTVSIRSHFYLLNNTFFLLALQCVDHCCGLMVLKMIMYQNMCIKLQYRPVTCITRADCIIEAAGIEI